MKKNIRQILSLALSLFIVTSCSNSYNGNTKDKDLDQKQKDSIESVNSTAAYNFDKHANIKVFVDDLAKAVSNNDKNTIAQMINFPLTDEWEGNLENQAASLTCKTDQQFFDKYDKIFTQGLKKTIAEKKYRTYTDNGTGVDVIEKGEYLIDGDGEVDGESERPHNMLGIKKINGIFKIYAVKFYS